MSQSNTESLTVWTNSNTFVTNACTLFYTLCLKWEGSHLSNRTQHALYPAPTSKKILTPGCKMCSKNSKKLHQNSAKTCPNQAQLNSTVGYPCIYTIGGRRPASCGSIGLFGLEKQTGKAAAKLVLFLVLKSTPVQTTAKINISPPCPSNQTGTLRIALLYQEGQPLQFADRLEQSVSRIGLYTKQAKNGRKFE